MPAARLGLRAGLLGLLAIGGGAVVPASFAQEPSDAAALATADRDLCPDPAGPVALGSAQWNGWGRDLVNSRYQPEPALRASDVPRLALKWAFGYPGQGVAGQPTVVDGRLFVAAPTGRVYALDARSGCIYWSYEVHAAVRTPMTIGESAPPKAVPTPKKLRRHQRIAAHLDLRKAPSALYFGDDRGTLYALDAERGTLLWKTVIDPHPLALLQAAPMLYKNHLYVATASSEPDAVADAKYPCCSFRGSVAALDADSGRIVWRTYTVSPEPRTIAGAGAAAASVSPGSAGLGSANPDTASPGPAVPGSANLGPAGVAVLAPPTIDAERGLLYVATGRAYAAVDQPLANAIVALDLGTGTVRWSKQPGPRSGDAGEFGGAPILRSLAGGNRLLLAAQHSGVVYSLDPDREGEIVWQTALMDGTHAGSVYGGLAADHRTLYVPLALVQTPQDAGRLVALDLKGGTRRWQADTQGPACDWGTEGCVHGQGQAVTVIPGAAFVGALDGHLRAFSTIDGKTLWDCATDRDFTTVNGVPARGGSLDEGGAIIVNGVLYVNSGYARGAGRTGNVLLAYSVEGK